MVQIVEVPIYWLWMRMARTVNQNETEPLSEDEQLLHHHYRRPEIVAQPCTQPAMIRRMFGYSFKL